MEQEITTFQLEEKNYLALEKIEMKQKTYLILVNEQDESDILVQEYQAKNPDVLYGVSQAEVTEILKIFQEKHKN